MMDLSIVIPLLNEQDSIEELFQRIKTVCIENNFTFEVIFIDDGSTDNSWKIIEFLADGNPEIKAVRFRKNYGKSQALRSEEHTSELQSRGHLVCRLLLEKKKYERERTNTNSHNT